MPDPLPQHVKPEEMLALEAQIAQRERRAQTEDWLEIALCYLLAHGGLRISYEHAWARIRRLGQAAGVQ